METSVLNYNLQSFLSYLFFFKQTQPESHRCSGYNFVSYYFFQSNKQMYQ